MTEVTYNILEPSLMSEHERHQEVARILAFGIIRLCHQAAQEAHVKPQIQLAMPAEKSVHTSPATAVLRAATLIRKRNAKR
jgi:hypothetical protein